MCSSTNFKKIVPICQNQQNIGELANEKGPQGGMELLVVQYCREDADFNKKDHQDRTKKAKVVRFQHFQNFAENVTQILGYRSLLG